jgi:hypothetical protein
MNSVPSALTFLLMIFAGWVNRQQLIAIEYLQAENGLLRERSRAEGLASATRTGDYWQGKPRRWVARLSLSWAG